MGKSFKSIVASTTLFVAAAPALADGRLSFVIDGDTFSQPFRIDNTSTAGETVLRFGLNLAGTGYAFDTVFGGGPQTGFPDNAATPFASVGGSGALTGLVGPVTVSDTATSFVLNFTDFNVGEAFRWNIDVDPLTSDPGRGVTVFGNNLIGATAFVDFSNGLRANGVLGAVAGSTQASAFSVTSVVVTPGVPELSTWAMMLIGFAGLGLASRRRQSAIAA